VLIEHAQERGYLPRGWFAEGAGRFVPKPTNDSGIDLKTRSQCLDDGAVLARIDGLS
jgi:hypothetical protein